MPDYFSMRPRNDPDRENGFKTRDLVRFLVVDIIIIICLQMLLGLGFFSTPGGYVLSVLASKAFLFAYLVWLIRDRRDAWSATGIGTAGRWWAWPLSLALYALAYPAMLWASGLGHRIMAWLYALFDRRYVPEVQDVVLLIFEDIVATPVRAVLVFFTVLLGPFIEELAFRGMGMDGFRRGMGAGWALFWTSLLFGLYHFSLAQLPPLALLGLLFGAVRLFSGSLWCAVAVHCLHNGVVLALGAYGAGWFDALRERMA